MAQQFIEFFHDETNRLETFQSIPNMCPLTISSLSRNGFIHTRNAYVCVICFKRMNNVDAGEDIVRRHHNMNKHCKLFTSGLNKPVDIKKFKTDRIRYLLMKFEYEKTPSKKLKTKNVKYVPNYQCGTEQKTRFKFKKNKKLK